MSTGSDISWTAARDAASARTFFGLQGYLTTVTSAAESAFVSSKLQSFSWLGASDAAVEGDWRWVTGPEAGTRFYTGVSPSGFAVPGSYTHWNPGEPNNGGGNQHYAISLDSANDGLWNDCPDLSCSITSYAVEYGGMVGDPVIQVSDDATVLLDPAGDPDSDGLPTSIEATYGTNPASTTSPVANPTADDDSDGVTNAWEAILQTDPTDADSNSGRTAATNEAANGTSDANEDFDGDSIPNLIEIRNGTDPLNPASPVAVNPTADPDSDGVTNAWERILGTDPANPDSDSTKTAPNEAGNGKNDAAEDFDGDGIPNRLEITYGTDPLDATSPMANPTADGDNDGLSNAWEAILGSDPAVADSNSTKTVANEAGNGKNDGAEDFDGDGTTNAKEIADGTDPLNASDPLKTDLEVTQTASTVNLSQLTLAITVRNKGPNPVTGAVLSDTFPTSIAGKVWTWTCVGTACPAASGTGNLSATNATLGALAVNETAVFTVTGEIADWSHWSNTASVLMPSGITDGVNTNDSLTAGRYQILMPLVIR